MRRAAGCAGAHPRLHSTTIGTLLPTNASINTRTPYHTRPALNAGAPEVDEGAVEPREAVGLVARQVPVEPVEWRVVAVRIVVAALPDKRQLYHSGAVDRAQVKVSMSLSGWTRF